MQTNYSCIGLARCLLQCRWGNERTLVCFDGDVFRAAVVGDLAQGDEAILPVEIGFAVR